ncbi:hypothetical protein MK805_03145 [Shimazuella sp. AN120528]|uniref:hypothetical protein n=1 Tax=Shimazuella soli TaxID=1892854 RepID=UPI001F11663F|nr:hypothetical protein [Shimazuella soli]MCH5583958.1 hypothetical protein [Shimazuella soli]
METKNMDVENRILFILGMSLCGVLVFVLVVGVIVALFTSRVSKKLTGTIDSIPIRDDEGYDHVENRIQRVEAESLQFQDEEGVEYENVVS